VTNESDHIRLMSSDDLQLVLLWRNHPDIRNFMYSNHIISLEEHKRWFKNVSEDDNKRLLIFETQESPMGFVQFSQKCGTPVADWGFYTAPMAPKGIGQRLGHAALNYAFQHINLHKVCGQALAFNEASIRFHNRMAFTQEGVLRDQHFDGEVYHDVICFGLLQSEWLTDS
jgi:UDP-4-amino-4,6-dideoxy-N-acetyl-beta-L-altrosamine N-acetyltransferase